jgi:GNAT superfamily N-acetyltransferase
MQLIHAEGAMLAQILDETFPIWHEGLTRINYERWNVAQMRTPWGHDHLRRLALVDDAGRLLSSAKRYRFTARLAREEAAMLGIGAVFTPPGLRGRGYAVHILERIIAEEAAAGTAFAALFSDIGDRFYRRAGFEPVPLDELTLSVARKNGAPAMLVRSGTDADLPAVAAMHDVRAASARVAVARRADLTQYAIAKRRLLAGLGPAGLRQTEFFVVEEGVSAVAYVVITSEADGWFIEEAGDRDPAGARLGAMLQVLLAREPSRNPPQIRAWWPSRFALPPQVTIADRTPATSILMVRPLRASLPRIEPSDVFYWHSDYF